MNERTRRFVVRCVDCWNSNSVKYSRANKSEWNGGAKQGETIEIETVLVSHSYSYPQLSVSSYSTEYYRILFWIFFCPPSCDSFGDCENICVRAEENSIEFVHFEIFVKRSFTFYAFGELRCASASEHRTRMIIRLEADLVHWIIGRKRKWDRNGLLLILWITVAEWIFDLFFLVLIEVDAIRALLTQRR